MSKYTKAKKKAMVQQPRPPSTEIIEMLPLLTDITCTQNTGISSWEAMYKMFEDGKPRIMERKATTDDFTSTLRLPGATSLILIYTEFLHEKLFFHT